MSRAVVATLGLFVVAGITGAAVYVALNPDVLFADKDYADFFKPNPETNTQTTPEQFALVFADTDGKPVDLAQFRGKKNVMLVFMRGYHNGTICPNCSAQTSRLIRNHGEFVRRDTEVLIVFPGPKDHLDEYIAQGRAKADNAAVPFRILLDPDFIAVDRLGIRGSLAKPSTYILDKAGKIRFAYVGSYPSDRPTLQAMLDQINRIRNDGGPS